MKQKKTFHLSLRRTWQLMTGGLSVVTLAALCWALCLSATLPDRYYLAKGSRFSLGDSSLIQTSSNDGYPLSVYSSTGNTFRMDLKLLDSSILSLSVCRWSTVGWLPCVEHPLASRWSPTA